nr:hypothetical protein CFP56_02965 [Quercus suber]
MPINGEQPKLPDNGLLAFAICIVTSRPKDVPVREYISLLRRHVAKGRRENTLSSAYRHLDRSSFWRSEFERTRDALSAKEGEVFHLHQELETLRSQLCTAKVPVPTKKRNEIDPNVVRTSESPKGARRPKSPDSWSTPCTDLAWDFQLPTTGKTGMHREAPDGLCCVLTCSDDLLMPALFQIKYLLASRAAPDPAHLYAYLTRAASALPKVLLSGDARSLSNPSPDHADLAELQEGCAGARRAITLILTSADKVGQVDEVSGIRGTFIYAFVEMYAELLRRFHEVSVAIVSAVAASTLTDNEKLKSVNTMGKPRLLNMKDHQALNAITGFLCYVVDVLDPKLRMHTCLFEGIAFLVIDKIGSVLFTLVFGHVRASTIEQEIARSSPADHSEHPDNPNPTTSGNCNTSEAELKAPYLIHLLKRVMAASANHLGSTKRIRAGIAKGAHNRTSTKGILAISAKERLQRTLVNCTFGTEGTDENDPFKDCLRMPNASVPPLPLPRVKEQDVPEWFQEEVWRLLVDQPSWSMQRGSGFKRQLECVSSQLYGLRVSVTSKG